MHALGFEARAKSFKKKKIDYVRVSAHMTNRKMDKMRLSYNYVFKYSDTFDWYLWAHCFWQISLLNWNKKRGR